MNRPALEITPLTKNHNLIEVPLIDEGHGPPVVFLHGAPDHRNEWRDVINLLRTDFRCLAPDLPGFGDSPTPPASYDFSIHAQAAFFETWIDNIVGPERVLLVMHDIGAIMGLAWASQNPERVRGLVIMNTILHSDLPWHLMARLWSSPILGRLFMLILNRPAWRLAFRRDFPQVHRRQVDSMYDGLSRVARRTILRHFQQMTTPVYFKEWEEQFMAATDTIPTTVLWGMQDPLIPQAYPQRLGGRLKPLDDCGHWVPLEQPHHVAAEVRLLDRQTVPS